jgi:hypothetical protein
MIIIPKFRVGSTYTCISSHNRGQGTTLTLMREYKCVGSENPLKFDPVLSKDGSTFRFEADDGAKISFFGCHAIQHFSNDKQVIAKALAQHLEWAKDNLKRAQEEVAGLTERGLRAFADLNEREKELAELENYQTIVATTKHF